MRGEVIFFDHHDGHSIMSARSARSAKIVVMVPLTTAVLAGTAQAHKKYDSGAIDTEIRLGNIMAYSGPLSAFANEGKIQVVYFRNSE